MLKAVAETTICLGKKSPHINAFYKKLPVTVTTVWKHNIQNRGNTVIKKQADHSADSS